MCKKVNDDEQGEQEVYTSKLFLIEIGLLKRFNSSIITDISPDGHTLTISNISERDMINIPLVTNDPLYDAVMTLEGCSVNLNNRHIDYEIPGFYQILEPKIGVEDATAFTNNKKTYTPFLSGFKCGTVNQLCDNLSGLTYLSPSTYGHVKTYTLVFHNKNSAGRILNYK